MAQLVGVLSRYSERSRLIPGHGTYPGCGIDPVRVSMEAPNLSLPLSLKEIKTKKTFPQVRIIKRIIFRSNSFQFIPVWCTIFSNYVRT